MPATKLFYFILAHRMPTQLRRLVHTLDDGTSEFLIHVDKRTAPETYAEFCSELATMKQVNFSASRLRCYWARFELVQATLNGMREFLQSGSAATHFCLLSGQDYPIKSAKSWHAFLATLAGKQIMEAFPFEKPNRWSKYGDPFSSRSRVQDWHFWFRSYRWTLAGHRKIPENFIPYGGSQWFCLTRTCVEFIVSFCNQHPSYSRYFAKTFIPDECFFQTLIMNSHFADQVLNTALHEMDWKRPNPNVPAIFMSDDLPRLAASSHFFARKFDAARDEQILDRIDKNLLVNTGGQ